MTRCFVNKNGQFGADIFSTVTTAISKLATMSHDTPLWEEFKAADGERQRCGAEAEAAERELALLGQDIEGARRDREEALSELGAEVAEGSEPRASHASLKFKSRTFPKLQRKTKKLGPVEQDVVWDGGLAHLEGFAADKRAGAEAAAARAQAARSRAEEVVAGQTALSLGVVLALVSPLVAQLEPLSAHITRRLNFCAVGFGYSVWSPPETPVVLSAVAHAAELLEVNADSTGKREMQTLDEILGEITGSRPSELLAAAQQPTADREIQT